MKIKFYKSFTFRIFSLMSLVIFLSLTALTLTGIYSITQSEMHQSIYSGTNTLNQAESFINYRVHAIKGILDVIIYDDTIQTVLSTSSDYYSTDIANWNIHTTDCREILYNSYTTDNIDEIRLYSSTGPASIEETNEFKKLTSTTQTEWYRRLSESTDSSIWLPGNFFNDTSEHIYYVRKIANLQRLGNYLGYVCASIPVSKLSAILDLGELTESTSLIMANSHGEIITAKNMILPDAEAIQQLITDNDLSVDDALKPIVYQDASYLCGYRKIAESDWTLMMLVPTNEIRSTTRQLLRQLIIFLVLIIIICLPIMYRISKSLNSRIVALKDMMKRSSSGNFITTQIDNGKDEIGELTQSFYKMQTKIASLMDDQYRLGYEIKNLEFQVLQSQINPHFLYNTLDMIHWMGLKNNCIDVSEAASKLGEFYMLSLGHGEKIVPIRDELRHVQAYVNIQNMRFKNRITLITSVPPELYSYYMIKIILQPIVENAINHGIRERDDETGVITINGSMDEAGIHLTVSDNGVGIPPEKLDTLLHKKPDQNEHGYGVWNIHERLHLSYGNEYGLRYSSEVGKGTTITIDLPAIKESESQNLES